MSRLLTISSSPHIHTRRTVSFCMWQVVIALLPALAVAMAVFGPDAAVVTATAVAGCVATEYAVTRWMLRRPATIANGSAMLTGLLLAMNLPSNLPVWIVLIGSVAAIGIGKMAYGGLGCNIFNPALVGRVFLLLSFPAQMTTWPLPMDSHPLGADAATGATILSQIRTGELDPGSIDLIDKMLGLAGGSLGEVGSAALLIGIIYLMVRRVISWHIPLSILLSAGALAWIAGANPAVELLSGGMILGAGFMATDYVTSPMTRTGMIIYGVMIGLITMVIRLWGAYPEGMSFAILIMNGFTPLINRYCHSRRYGYRKEAAA